MKAVFFDLDETVLDRSTSLKKYVQWQATQLFDLQESDREKFIERFIVLDDNGNTWKDAVFEQLLIEFPISSYTVAQLVEEYLRSFANFCCPKPYILNSIKEIKAMGLKIGLVSNGRSPFQERNFLALGMSDYFDTIVVSEAVRLRKPDPEIFHLASRNVDVTAAECVFVGDNPIADIEGSNAVGMYSVFVPSEKYPVCQNARAVCDDFRKLTEIILRAKRSTLFV